MNENGKAEETGLDKTQVIGNAEAREDAEAQAAPKKGWAALSKNAKIGIGAGCAVVVAAAVGIGAYALTHQASTLPADEPVEGAQLAEPEEEGAPQKATLGYSGYEPAEGDTPVIVHVTGTTDGNRSVDFYHLVSGAAGDVELDPGMYTAEALPVLLRDGSMMSPKDGQAAFSVDDAAVEAQQAFDVKSADDVTEADLSALLDKIAEGTAKGDETLKGDAGKEAASKAAEAVKATGKMDAEKVEQAERNAEENSKGEAQVTVYSVSFQGGQAVANASSSAGASAPASQESTASASDPSPAPAASNNGSASASQPAPEPQQPAHEHSWEAITEDKWFEDSPAWDEPIYSQQAQYMCAGCGAVLTGDPYSHFTRSGCVNGSKASNFREVWNQVQTGTVHHDAVGHYETVTTGYRCATCGATK